MPVFEIGIETAGTPHWRFSVHRRFSVPRRRISFWVPRRRISILHTSEFDLGPAKPGKSSRSSLYSSLFIALYPPLFSAVSCDADEREFGDQNGRARQICTPLFDAHSQCSSR